MKSSVNKLIMIVWCFCLASFIFAGPTGVGKTELTKALAEYMFDDELVFKKLFNFLSNVCPLIVIATSTEPSTNICFNCLVK